LRGAGVRTGSGSRFTAPRRRTLAGLAAALALAATGICAAEGPPAQVWQQLRERELRQEELALKQRQYQEAARGDSSAAGRARLERRQAAERWRFQLLEQAQTREIAEAAARESAQPAVDTQIRRDLDERRARERLLLQHGDRWRADSTEPGYAAPEPAPRAD